MVPDAGLMVALGETVKTGASEVSAWLGDTVSDAVPLASEIVAWPGAPKSQVSIAHALLGNRLLRVS